MERQHMADIDRLREILGDSPGAKLLIELEALRIENDALRRDAERYRWLSRECVNYYNTGIMPDLVWQGPDWHDISSPEMLDAGIDAAMNGANK